MRIGGLIQGEFAAASHNMSDVIRFCVSLVKWRADCKQRPLGATNRTWLDSIRRSIVQWLACAIDHYTLHEYPKYHNVDKQPPSIRRGPLMKQVRMHPDAVWDMLQISLNTAASLSMVVQVRAAQEDAGVDRRSAPRWETLLQGMYHHRTSLVWPTLNHICMTADSSTHCYEDTMLAMCYSWEIDQACYPTLQHIVTGTNPSFFLWLIGIGASQHFANTV